MGLVGRHEGQSPVQLKEELSPGQSEWSQWPMSSLSTEKFKQMMKNHLAGWWWASFKV